MFKNFATVDDGVITQLACGFIESPFDDGIEVSEEVSKEPSQWFLEEGNFIYYSRLNLVLPEFCPVGQMIVIEPVVNREGQPVVLWIDDEEKTRGVLPLTWQVQFDTPGTYEIRVDAGRHGRVQKQVVVS